jgi:hypothetical protein
LGVEGGLRTHRGDLVCFARHRWCVCWLRKDRSRWRDLMIP